MKAVVTLNLFSGFPDARWKLPAAEARRLFERLQSLPLEAKGFLRKPGYEDPLDRPRAGYRGFTLTFDHAGQRRVFEVFDGFVLDRRISRVRRDTGLSMARELFDSIPKDLVQKYLQGKKYDEIIVSGSEGPITGIDRPKKGRGGPPRRRLRCRTSPRYVGHAGAFKTFRTVNNCYNYATGVLNKVTLKQAIPGTPNVRRPLSMAKLRAAIESDRLEPLGLRLPRACPPPGSHYVAVLLRKSPAGIRDFHCLRLDRDGGWSHKDGGGEVTNVDDNGNRIVNLETAALKWDPQLAGFYRFVARHRKKIK